MPLSTFLLMMLTLTAWIGGLGFGFYCGRKFERNHYH